MCVSESGLITGIITSYLISRLLVRSGFLNSNPKQLVRFYLTLTTVGGCQVPSMIAFSGQ